MKEYEHRHQDDLDWWTRRYTALCTTRADEVVRKAVKTLNEATKIADKVNKLVTQFGNEVEEAEREIKRIGGAARIEELRPMIEKRNAALLEIYESLKNWRLVEKAEEKPNTKDS